jgi:hypothetical protein
MITSQADKNKKEAESVVSMWNKCRLRNKGEWVFHVVSTNRLHIHIKSFDCWIQVIEINDSLRDGSPPFSKVGDIKRWLSETVFIFLQDSKPAYRPTLVQVFD